MYEKVSTNLNFVDREKKTEEFWKENDIFRKSTARFIPIRLISKRSNL